MGPEVFNPDVRLHWDTMYLQYDLADLTTMPGARCVAIQSQTNSIGPRMGVQFISPQLVRESVEMVIK